VGLEEGIKQVTLIMAGVTIICFFLIPGFLGLVGGIVSLFLIWIVAVMVVSWHWSPFCLYLAPSFFMRPGLVLPILPVPISTMVFPECLWDEIIALTDK